MRSTSAYLLSAPRTLRRERIQLPPLPSDWARVRFHYCGLCGSDLSCFEDRRPADYPLSLGHEFVAEVVQVGADVRHLTEGDTVVSDLNHRCERCDHCRAGRSHLCRDNALGLFTNRAFAELGDLHEGYLLRVSGPPLRRLALAEPLSCVLHAKTWSGVGAHDRVLVIGAGGIGLCMAFALCAQSIPFEIAEAIPSRRHLIARAAEPLGRAVAAPEGEYDIVFDLSGSESGLRTACEHVRAGGRLCTMSHLDGSSEAPFLLAALTRCDVTFTVSYLNGERSTLVEAAALLTERWSGPWEETAEVLQLVDLQRAFERRRESPRCKTLIRTTLGPTPA